MEFLQPGASRGQAVQPHEALLFHNHKIMSTLDLSISTTDAVNQNQSLSHAQMDAIGSFDENCQQKTIQEEENDDMEALNKVTVSVGQDLEIESHLPLSALPLTALEIAEGDDGLNESDIDEDLERLLSDSVAVQRKKIAKNKCCFSCTTRLIGNHTIFCGEYFDKTGWGIVGPHWFGPGCVLAIVAASSYHFFVKALEVGPMSLTICVLFALSTTYHLIDTAFRDPGICMDTIRPTNAKNASDYIWCDFCSVFQPPDGAHCPDCNVCVAGYDHHCVWMGTCIGKKNFKQFVRFNLSWIGYLLYAILWITVVGPAVYHREK